MAGDELALYQNALSQMELADKLGYDHAWVVEHHFLEEYSHSPSPESFLAAASQRTKNIRLGHGILQLTTNHPARVAERVAVLDLLSNGRCEFGMGESASITELTPFGREVMPEFQNDPAQAAWKQGVMSGEIKLEEIDTEAFTDRYGKLAINVAPARAAAG